MAETRFQAQLKDAMKEIDDKYEDRFQNIEESIASLSSAITRRTNTLLEAISSLSNQREYSSSDDTSSGVANPQNHHPNYAGVTRMTKLESTASIAPTAQPLNSDSVTGEKSVSFHSNRLEISDKWVKELHQLKETDGILDYHDQFEQISTKVNLPEEYLVSVYLAGLRNDTQVNVSMFEPQSIRQCLMIGRLYEDAHRIERSTNDLHYEQTNESLIRQSNFVAKDVMVMDETSSMSAVEKVLRVRNIGIIFSGEPEVHQSQIIVDKVTEEVVCRDDRQGKVSSLPSVIAQQEVYISQQGVHTVQQKFCPSLLLSVTCELVMVDGFKELSYQQDKIRQYVTTYVSEFTSLEVHNRVWEPGGLLGVKFVTLPNERVVELWDLSSNFVYIKMGDSLYDEFGNYIGAEIKSHSENDDEIEDEMLQENKSEEDGSDGKLEPGGSNGWITTIKDVEMDNQIILPEDKKYYPTAEEVYGEDEQPFEKPIIELVRDFRLEVEVKDSSTYVSTQFLIGLMSNPTFVRNVALVGYLQRGKTVLFDMLVEQTHHMSTLNVKNEKHMKYTDTRDDEREMNISIKAVPMSLVLEDSRSKSYLCNFIDNPGHVKFSAESTASLRLSAGDVLIVDTAEGVVVNTDRAIRHAIQDHLPIIVVLNKFDRLITELTLPPRDAMVTIFPDINREMEKPGTRKKLFKLVGKANPHMADMIMKLDLLEESDTNWKDAKYAQIWEYFRDEIALTERLASLDFMVKIVEHVDHFIVGIGTATQTTDTVTPTYPMIECLNHFSFGVSMDNQHSRSLLHANQVWDPGIFSVAEATKPISMNYCIKISHKPCGQGFSRREDLLQENKSDRWTAQIKQWKRDESIKTEESITLEISRKNIVESFSQFFLSLVLECSSSILSSIIGLVARLAREVFVSRNISF